MQYDGIMPGYRILVVCGGNTVSGLEIVNLTLMKQLKEKGFSVYCLTSGWNDGAFISRLQALDIPYQCVKLGNLYISRPVWTLDTILNFPKAAFQIKNLLKRFQPDTIILNEHKSFLYSGFLWKGFNVIFWEHNLPPVNLFNKITYRRLAKTVSHIVACSEYVNLRLSKIISGHSKIRTIYNGIHTADSCVAHETKRMDNGIRIGIVGQVIPRKGHMLLLEALSILVDRGLPCAIYVYGNDKTEYAREMRQFAEEIGISKHIYWMGFVQDKNMIYNKVDIVVVPSVGEPFGLVALEPALWKVPVVAARSGGLPEIIKNEFNGLLFEPGNSNDLATQLEKLISHPQLRSEIGQQAKTVLREQFSADRMTERFIEIFELSDTSEIA